MICIIACGSEKVKDIERILTSFGVESAVVSMDNASTTDFQKYVGVIISGSPILVTETGMELHLAKFQFLQNYDKPVLGICFGHQVLCLLYGASGIIGEEVRREELVDIIELEGLFSSIDEQSHFAQNHYEYMTVPEDFVLLAKSDSCPNEAVRHRTKPIFGVQFHPEVSGPAGEQLIRNFVDLCE